MSEVLAWMEFNDDEFGKKIDRLQKAMLELESAIHDLRCSMYLKVEAVRPETDSRDSKGNPRSPEEP